MNPIRVLVVDDSALMRHRLSVIIGASERCNVVGTASNGRECLTQMQRLMPDVITLDVEMPEMDGLETLRHIMQQQPTPVLMISSLTEAGAQTTLEALSRGAVDYLAKPSTLSTDPASRFATDLIEKLDVASTTRIRKAVAPFTVPAPASTRPASLSMHTAKVEERPIKAADPAPIIPSQSVSSGVGENMRTPRVTGALSRSAPLVVIGSSTGGPQALDTLFGLFSQRLNAWFLVVQHMPPIFTRSLAQRLDRRGVLDAREAADGDSLVLGTALVAPGGYHLTLGADGLLHTDERDPLHGVRPAIDHTLYSVAEHWRGRLLVVILTGMGVDGADGSRRLHAKGVDVFAQDESTSIVYGMPRAVVEAGAATATLPLNKIAEAIEQWVARPSLQPTAV